MALLTEKQLAKLEVTPDPRTEAQFQAALLRLLRGHGWRCTHNPPRPSRKGFVTFGDPGFPDVVALRPPDLVFLECKMVGGVVKPEQRVWLNGLADAGVEAWVVNVGDWPLLVRLARGGVEAITAVEEGELYDTR